MMKVSARGRQKEVRNMATKNTAKNPATRTYGPRKPKYVLVVEVDGVAFSSVESWTDRGYAEYRATKVAGSTVMQRGRAE